MKTRRSPRNQEILFKQLFQPQQQAATERQRPAYLDMTDAEIDREYFNYGKADRTRMKKLAAQERLRQRARKVLRNEP